MNIPRKVKYHHAMKLCEMFDWHPSSEYILVFKTELFILLELSLIRLKLFSLK